MQILYVSSVIPYSIIIARIMLISLPQILETLAFECLLEIAAHSCSKSSIQLLTNSQIQPIGSKPFPRHSYTTSHDFANVHTRTVTFSSMHSPTLPLSHTTPPHSPFVGFPPPTSVSSSLSSIGCA